MEKKELNGELFTAPRYWVTIFPLKVMGQWPYLPKKLIYIRTPLWFLLLASLFLPELYYSLAAPTMDTIVTGLPPQVTAFVSIVKLVNNLAMWSNVKQMLLQMEQEWQELKPGPEYDIMLKYSYDGRKYAITYFMIFYVFMTVYLSMPHFGEAMYVLGMKDSPGEFIFSIPADYYFFNCYNYRTLIEIHIDFTIAAICTTLVTFDSLFIMFVQHVCGILARICYRLENIPIKPLSCANVFEQNRHQDEAYMIISDCVKRHIKALEFAETIRETFSWSLFVSVIFSVLIIAFSLMQMANHVNDRDVLIQYAPFLGGQLTYFFVESAISQQLLNNSGQVEYSIRLVKWYAFSLNSRKMLNLISLRSRNLCKITAGAFFDLSVELYVVVVKTAFSYFTVLLSMKDEED